MIRAEGISKGFPGVRALHEVGFDCAAGEVVALVGENGAGKSTLIKILSGVYRADAGRMTLDGQPVDFTHPLQAIAAGISVIHQEFSLLPDRTVAQNVFLGREPRRRGLIDAAAMRTATRAALSIFDQATGIDPDTLVADLDVASQQMVEIAKAISLDAKVVVMDEPSAALNEAECEALFAVIDRLRARGAAVIYISHRMREIARLADRVVVLKDGEVAARFDSLPPAEDIVRAMVGRDLRDFYAPPATADEVGEALLTLRGCGNDLLDGVDLDLRRGEITGIAGIQGAGPETLAAAIFGAAPFTHGEMRLKGEVIAPQGARAAIAAGIGLLPGDRKGEGLALMQSVRDNGMLTSRAFAPTLGPQTRNTRADIAAVDALFDRLEVKAADYDQEIKQLSGGNQQKAIIARWLTMAPDVLIFIEPTRGIDVNAKAGIYHLMRDLVRQGAAILMVSTDLPELIGAADRILVMRNGRLVAEFPHGPEEAAIMLAAVGEEEAA